MPTDPDDELRAAIETSQTWRSVRGWEGEYFVSDAGLVVSISKVGKIRFKKPVRPHPLRPYLCLTFQRGKVRQRKYLHHVVMEAFVGPRPDGHEVDHLNNRPEDCRLENMEWVTHAENVRRKGERIRARRPVPKEHHPREMTLMQARLIMACQRMEISRGWQRVLASMWNVRAHVIYAVASGRRWGNGLERHPELGTAS